jgi:hypothetical protein
MKKIVRKISLILMSVVASTSIVNAQGYIVHDLTTGVVNGTTTLIPYGSVDDTWQLSLPGRPGFYQDAKVCSNLSGAWAINSCGRWITHRLDGIEPSVNNYTGTFTYITTFNMSHHCIPWAKINFAYVGGDNNIILLYLNGHPYNLNPATADDFNPLTQNVTIDVDPNHILLGANNITVAVKNNETYTGFYACGNVSIGYCPRPVSSPNDTNRTSDRKFKPEESFKVFPNPNTGQFSLRLDHPAEGNVEVIDLTGRKVWSSNLSANQANYEIDLKSHPKGIYNLSIRTEKTVQSRKIILE